MADLTRTESPAAMETATAAQAEQGQLPTFIRETDAESILRQRATAQAQPGGGANNLRSSSVPNLAHTRRETIPTLPAFQRKQTTLKAAIVENLQPKVPVGKAPGWRTSAMSIVKYSWLNVLLIFVPVSWAMHFSGQSPTVTFVMSFLAIVPLAALLGFATEEIALRVGDTFGGLLNATFGNAVELIISILALVKGELNIVRSSMLGSILSNTLLVLGMCYFAGGLRFHEQGYGVRAAQLNINLLGISVTAIVIPVAFHVFLDMRTDESIAVTDESVLKISRGVAIILLFVYGGYLTFQLWTRAYLYMPQEQGPDDPPPPPALPFIEGPQPPTEGGVFRIPSLPSWGGSSSSSSSSASTLSADEHTPKLSIKASFALLLAVTVVTGFTAEWLVSSIDGLTSTGAVSTEFVALILLPLVGNAAEHVTAVTVAAKGKLDLSMAVAVGSSIQIALFVIPILILLGWCIGQPLSFYFDPFETVVLFISVVSVNWAIADGRTNWLEGMTLMVIYLIIALVFWYYPGLE
ncbi:Sodium/calcium exchanger protein-domain-containing protein [Leucosporidium creatinivorum]|uniref:Sodium/calcium exchanger protein-domain-containing protein n=1 Tax=Leucosporidium creatinivorum TaxID=106004 RepID=A0A1Y2ELJ3_9BASI|nr:Sodium/calcium exchanger protein-domain-containing protein [Leucosporidium creatinivorum]